MPRVPVPDDYDGDEVLVAGTEDAHYPYADVQVESERARTLRVREDDEGKYVGPPEQHVGAVAEFFGVDWTEDDPNAPSNNSDEDTASGGEDVEICGAEKSDGEICERPAGECPYHGED